MFFWNSLAFSMIHKQILNICKKHLKKQNINTFGIYSKVTNNGNKNHKRECIQNLNVKDRMDFTMSYEDTFYAHKAYSVKLKQS